MIRDITIGQYYPGTSVLHRADPRMKILLVIAYIVMLYSAGNRLGALVGIFVLVVAYAVAKVPLRMIVRSLKPILPIIVFTAILNLFFVEGEALFSIGPAAVTKEGLSTAAFMVIRFVCLIAGTSLLTYTTTPIALTDAIEILLGPLKKIRVPVHELAMMMTIALRFIPTLIDETDKIMNAQKARGADMESGGVIKRAKAMVPILIPLFVSAFRRAEELALAMECRCYHGGEGRTRMKQLKMGAVDAVCAAFLILCCAVSFAVNQFAPLVV